MDPRFAEQFQRARAYTSQGRAFVARSRNPLEALLFGIAAILFVALLVVLIVPFVLLVAAFSLGAIAYLNLRRALRRLGKPNNSIGPVRTDGRDNVRVINGDRS
ncbi:MAG: hypothetical protein AAF108_01115 [Planctomycetota bacterium]